MPEQKPLEIRGWDATQPHSLGHFLESLPTPPRLLGLGEPTHGVQAFPRWRNRLFQVLVEAHGFRSIALESDVLAGLKVNDYALGSPGSLDEVMSAGFSHGFGAYAANRELVAWLREYNVGRPDAEQVRFYGFDPPMESMWAASPRLNLLALHNFLAAHLNDLPIDAARMEQLCGDDARWTNEAAALDATKSIGRSDEARALRLMADDLHNLLQRETPRLQGQSGFWLAQLHARTALGLLRYHAIVANPAPGRVSQMLAQRGLMMADNLSAIAQREKERGPTLVFAHNTHLQRGQSRWQDWAWHSAGAHLNTRLGEGYAFIASTLGTGEGVPEPVPDTLEGFLSGQTNAPRLYRTASLKLPDSLGRRTDLPRTYIALKPETLHEADGLLFLPTTKENA